MILISRTAARAIFAETQRWVEEGLRQAATPFESLVYPLSALIPSGPLLTPVELADLDHLRAIVIDDVAIPPDPIKSFSAANCHFDSDDIEGANREFNHHIDDLLSRRPRLGVHSKLHSHPFASGDFLSSGDMLHGVTSRQAVAWRHSRGLATAILHVVYPDDQPSASNGPWKIDAAGALDFRNGRSVRWRIRSWGSVRDGAMQDLGDAVVVPDSHSLVRAARRQPYWRSLGGSRWCDAQKVALREAGYTVSRNLLGRGWRRYLALAGGRTLLLALPPDLPAAPLRVLQIRDALANDFVPLALPGWAMVRQLGDLSLLRLVKHFGEPSS